MEQPLAPHSACNLSSFNISNYVINPFTNEASFNYEALYHDVTVVTKAMDDIIDENINNHALEQQKEMSRKFRNIGIGIMGASDALLKLNCKYGSEESITFLQDVLRTMFRAALMTSAQLGKYRGNFPGYSEKIWDAEILRAAFNEDEIAALKQNNALRNCSLISIAPTGSLSTTYNLSGGIEPHFMLSYKRKTESLHGDKTVYYNVDVETVKQYKEITGNAELPDWFVTAMDINPVDRVKLQGAVQQVVDTAINELVA